MKWSGEPPLLKWTYIKWNGIECAWKAKKICYHPVEFVMIVLCQKSLSFICKPLKELTKSPVTGLETTFAQQENEQNLLKTGKNATVFFVVGVPNDLHTMFVADNCQFDITTCADDRQETI